MCKRLSPFVVVMLFALANSAEAAPVVLNPSFEDVPLGPPFRSANPADIPGWTHSGDGGDGLLWAIGYSDSGGSVTVAGDGRQFVTMGGGATAFGVAHWEQLVPGFTAGNTYRLTFKMATEFNGSPPQGITVDFPVGSATAAQTFTAATPSVNYWSDWETKTMTFVANAAAVDLRFSASTQYDVGLDSISLADVNAAVPEPASLTLLGIGIAGLAGYNWRRRKQPA